MKRLFILCLVLLCTAAGAQDRFSCNFKLYDKKSGEDPVMSGVAYVQGHSYRVESADGFVIGDGTTRWIYYSKSEELVIEDDDPAIFKKLKMVKTSSSEATVTFSRYTAKLTKIKETDELPAVFFNADLKARDKNVIVTDLRD